MLSIRSIQVGDSDVDADRAVATRQPYALPTGVLWASLHGIASLHIQSALPLASRSCSAIKRSSASRSSTVKTPSRHGLSLSVLPAEPSAQRFRPDQLHRGSECHREGAGALSQRVTVRFLHSALTSPIIGFVPVVRRVVSGVGPAGALLSQREPVLLDSDLTKRSCRSRTTGIITSSRSTIMPSALAGIDPHQDSITVGIIDSNGVELTHQTFPTTSAGYVEAIDLLRENDVDQVGVEGSASWSAHASIALVAVGFDAREVPAQRSAAQRRARRLEKTDAVDAVAAARALLAEPTLGPVQTLEVYNPLVAKIEAVLEHRRMLVDVRTLVLHHAQDQINKLPIEIRDQLTSPARSRDDSVALKRLTSRSCRHCRVSTGSHG